MKKLFASLFLFCFLLTGDAVIYAPVYNPAAGAVVKNFVRVGNAHHLYSGTSVTWTSTAGNCIIVGASGTGSSAITISDGVNSYTQFSNQALPGTGGRLGGAVAFNIAGGSVTVSTTSSGGDMGISALEYSGVTGLSGSSNGSGASPNPILTITENCMFVSIWGDESGSSTTTDKLNPGNVSGVAPSPLPDLGHSDGMWEFLNSSTGFSSGTYTNTVVGTSSSGYIFVALK